LRGDVARDESNVRLRPPRPFEAGPSRCDRIIRLLDGRIVDDIDVPPASDEREVLARIGRLDVAMTRPPVGVVKTDATFYPTFYPPELISHDRASATTSRSSTFSNAPPRTTMLPPMITVSTFAGFAE
jgi:hypothetical protein